MSNRTKSCVSKCSGDRNLKSNKTSSLKSEKSVRSEKCHKMIPKKVLPSKKITPSCAESKSCSAGVANNRKGPVKCKSSKTTKSESKVAKKCTSVVDYYNECGDKNPDRQSKERVASILKSMNVKCVRNDNNVSVAKKSSKPLQQYYKNENFHTYEESVHESTSRDKKKTLDPIKEVSEMHTISDPDSIFNIFSDSDEEVTTLEPSSDENIEKIKEFRQKYYFECHSAKSRIGSRVSATSLTDHKCVYRFYLNDRLFPVPLNTDYNNKVRCVECHLPMDIKGESSDDKINGTIQAKVKLGSGDTEDMILLLPVKDTLIIEERRKVVKPKDDYVYFGVVKLSAYGNSIFNKTLPDNSLALKYQKGYQEHQDNTRYNYKKIQNDDIIII